MEKNSKSDIAKLEEEALVFWKEKQIFEKSLKKPSPKGEFIFYEGPPTANGRPGVHHLEARAFKDAITRYRTMRGHHVRRRAGWDTHGLPVELEVEKQLHFTGKKDIEQYGIAPFNKKCRESVLKYIDEWQKFTERIGYWVDQSEAYFTYNAPYMESLWSILKQVDTDKRLYKDYKIVPWCTRCGTALSSHELAQGYENVKDLSVTVAFPVVGQEDTSFLAWTTTPWTLPGNVALAVGTDITYVTVEKKNDDTSTKKFILAKSRLQSVFKEGEYTVVDEKKGSELVGMEYEPVYPFAKTIASESEKPKFEKAFKVYPAPFVTTEDGTGIVHIAVMYGQDDFELGTEIGLPKVHVVGVDGLFIHGTGFLDNQKAKDEDVAVDIIKDLAGRGRLFSKEKHEHTYPFCWRCKTPLIYYARDSWYINMQGLRDLMIEENKRIHWVPEHIRDGRFGEWLKGVKDWAISRERYWGTPLPVWENTDGSERVVIGSLKELSDRTKTGNNTYLAIRHGESQGNVAGTTSTTTATASADHLTDRGKKEVLNAAKALKDGGGVDIIIASPLARTQETAVLLAKEFGINEKSVISEDRLQEIKAGVFDSKPVSEYESFFTSYLERFTSAPEGGETLNDVRERTGALLYELESRYKGKRILLVSHARTIWALFADARGLSVEQAMQIEEPDNAEITPLNFLPLPHNEQYELDLHRPYIDDVVLVGGSGTELRRIPEVMDVWFDSGAMPFAAEHYPFENKEWVDGVGYPADFISEAIDQTRGWFYTLHAVGALVGRGAAYKNVISLGHLLDDSGHKMSKSKGNVINPWEAVNTWGVDTLRFWMYSVNQPGEPKLFDKKTVRESARILSWFENSAKFYELFKDVLNEAPMSQQVIDRWMLLRTHETVRIVTTAFESYQLFEGARAIAVLLEDLSQWYVRRIRDRARDGDRAAMETLRQILNTIALLIAPLSPFVAERVFQSVRTEIDEESVHLAVWVEEKVPSTESVEQSSAQMNDKELLVDMHRVRELASEALMLRQRAGIKVRQPLGTLSIPNTLSEELSELLAQEVNVKQIKMNAPELELDTNLTEELVAEGDVREFMRAVAEARKELKLSPQDIVHLNIAQEGEELLSSSVLSGVKEMTFNVQEDAPYVAKLSYGEVRFSITHHAS